MARLRLACVLIILASAVLLAQSNPVPFITQPLVPVSVAPGSGGFTLTVNGAGFGPNAEVYWNGSIRSTTVLSVDTVQAQITAADVAKDGTGWVTVANPGGVFSNVVYLPIRVSALGLGFLETDSPISALGPVVAGDFNNDGKLDAAVAGDGGTFAIFLGTGQGTFGSPIVNNSKITNVRQMVTGDFNGDGNLDLAVQNGTEIGIYLGKGDGTFTLKRSFAGPPRNSNLAVADFNGDGKIDLYVEGRSSYFVIYLGNGDGTFNYGYEGYFNCNRGAPGTPAVADFNGDGLLDLAVIDRCNGGSVHVFLNNGAGFTEEKKSYFIDKFGGQNIAAADVNGDGKVDLVTDGVSVLLGNGDGTFKNDGGILSNSGNLSINVGDFNGDGKLDIAAGQSLLLGNGDGTFQAPLIFAGLPSAMPLSMGDFNGDGKLDLIGIAGSATWNLSFYEQVRVYLTPQDFQFGDQNVGTTSPPQTASVTNFSGNPLVITKINITGSNFKDFGQTNDCGSGLPPNGSCTIQVTFTPSLVGNEIALLNVTYQAAGTLTMPLYGTGVQQVNTVTLTPSSLTFPLQLVGTTSSPQTATLTNTGNEPVAISNISATAPFSETNNCPPNLSVGAACQIQVVFTPTGSGKASGQLSVTDNAQGSPQTVALLGVGESVKLSPSSIDFGNQKVGTTSVPVPITLNNLGTTTLNISQIKIKGTDAGDFAQTNNCGNSVPGGGHCKITVTFTPKAKGHRSAEVTIHDDGGGSPQTVPLSGAGTE
jgi:hypothetical protein